MAAGKHHSRCNTFQTQPLHVPQDSCCLKRTFSHALVVGALALLLEPLPYTCLFPLSFSHRSAFSGAVPLTSLRAALPVPSGSPLPVHSLVALALMHILPLALVCVHIFLLGCTLDLACVPFSA